MNVLINPFIISSRGAFLDSVISSVCCDLDATLLDSYSGSGQTWANLIEFPADGASQPDYDFWLGADGDASTDDPTHTGTPGGAGAYWLLDGGDHFQIKSFSAALTLYNMHRTDSSKPWWIAVVFQVPTNFNKAFWGASWLSADIGTYMLQGASDGWLYTGTGTLLSFNKATGKAPTYNTPYIVIMSGNNSLTTNNVKAWYATETGVTYSKTWDTNTSNPNRQFLIGSAHNASGPVGQMTNLSRLYAWSCGNELLDDTKATAIINLYNARYGRDLAP